MPSPEQLIELTFPLAGIDQTTEFQLQPENTTPIAVNVRSIDPVESRNRGASRCGIRKYVQQKLGLLSLIQHINIIVDPTIEAAVDEEQSLIWMLSPRGRLARRGTGGARRWLRKGGSGVRQRENRRAPACVDDTVSAEVGGANVTVLPLDNDTYTGTPTLVIVGTSKNFVGSYSVSGPVGGWQITYTPPADGNYNRQILIGYSLRTTGNKGRGMARIVINLTSTSTIEFVQSITDQDETHLTTGTAGVGVAGTPFNMVFTGTPETGNLLVVFVTSYGIVDEVTGEHVDTTLTVQNLVGGSYTQIGTYQHSLEDGITGHRWATSMWYRVASAGVSEQTVVITPTLTATGASLECFSHHLSAGHEYRNTNAAPFDAYAENLDMTAPPAMSLTTGTVTISATDQLIAAAYRTADNATSYSLAFTTATQRTFQGVDFTTVTPGQTTNASMALFTADLLEVVMNVAVPATSTGDYYQAIGASFKKE